MNKDYRSAIYSFIERLDSEHSKVAYLGDLKQFFESVPIFDLTKISKEHLIFFKNKLKERYSTASVARKITTLRAFFNWLEETEVISKNPSKFVRAPRQDSQYGKTPEISDAEVRLLLGAPDCSTHRGLRDYLILAILWNTGVRASELLGLRHGDFTHENGFHILTVRGKGNLLRRIPLKDYLAHELRRHIAIQSLNDTNAFIFSPSVNNRGKYTDKAISRSYLRHLVRSYAAKAGISDQITTHSARVTACSHVAERGASELEIRSLFGWRSDMSPRYARRRGEVRNSAAHKIAY